MFKLSYIVPILLLAACSSTRRSVGTPTAFDEPYRPQVHFSPPQKWMNDPNGMVFHEGTYNLFYQYYPDSTVWGPMHWGHATTTDLVHWQHQPIALYPDSLGYIFSGSAVVDVKNTSGFGRNGKAPMVAVFTHHDPKGESSGRHDYQNESLAYSLDDGRSWTKYAGNPVLRTPGINDFRDPKVMWYEPTQKWIMSLATHDRISFYSSPDLKTWTPQSDFGSSDGAHGGVWECPDLFPLRSGSEEIWVLLVSINPGGPNGGSATQYFTGQFNGHEFIPFEDRVRWIDHGPDDYAGVTWSNTGTRKIFLGWMSNWLYGQQVPTGSWRSAMTVPRELSIVKVKDRYIVASKPVAELKALEEKPSVWQNPKTNGWNGSNDPGILHGPARITISSDALRSFALTLSNEAGEKVIVGYDRSKNEYYIDRSASGDVSFVKGFGARYTAPRTGTQSAADLTLIVDRASVELFADGGLTAMTAIFFPSRPYTRYALASSDGFSARTIEYAGLKSIYRGNK